MWPFLTLLHFSSIIFSFWVFCSGNFFQRLLLLLLVSKKAKKRRTIAFWDHFFKCVFRSIPQQKICIGRKFKNLQIVPLSHSSSFFLLFLLKIVSRARLLFTNTFVTLNWLGVHFYEQKYKKNCFLFLMGSFTLFE